MKKSLQIIFICIVLVGLFLIQKYFNDNSLFKKYPYTGELLHFTAGMCVAILINIFLEVVFPSMLLIKRILVILLGSLLIELSWEFIEVLLGWNNRQEFAENIMNTIDDIVITFVGALAGVLFFVKK